MFLIGRQRERESVRRALRRGQVVVLVGPAGIGKSALAASLVPERPVLWIDARGSLDPEALEGARTGRRDAAELVVIDGVRADEELAWVQELVEQFATPVVLTSRTPLGLGEHVELGPLEPAEGAALLRAKVSQPARAATLAMADLERLSQALDGNPQALCEAARRLALASVDELIASPAQAGQQRRAFSPLQTRLLAILDLLPGPVPTWLLTDIVQEDTREAVLELVDEGVLEAWPSGSSTVRPRGTHSATSERDAALLARLTVLLPDWEALAPAVEDGGWRDQTARLHDALPALEYLCAEAEIDTALRAACVAGVVYQRRGPERRCLALDAMLGDGGDPDLAAQWARFAAKASIRFNEGPPGLATLDRRPPPPGSIYAVDHQSLRARLLELSGERERGQAMHRAAVDASEGSPFHGDILYRDAVSRYWVGDIDGALNGLDRALACSDPTVHSLRVVKVVILQTLLRRNLGADADELLAGMLPIDPLWRQTECPEGPTVLVLMGALSADVQDWARSEALLEEAIGLFLRLGRRDEAANQVLQRASFEFVHGRIPTLDLTEVVGPGVDPMQRLSGFSRAELLCRRSVAAAARGRVPEARVLVRDAQAMLEQVGRPQRFGEVAAYVVAALIGSGHGDDPLATSLLERVDGGPQLARMRGLLTGAPELEGAERFEDHVIRALLARREGPWVAEDGSWFELTGQERIDIGRRVVLKRALGALARALHGLTLNEFVSQTWPKERLVGDSGRRRAEVTISNLRKLGLRELITTVPSDEGTRWRLEAVIV